MDYHKKKELASKEVKALVRANIDERTIQLIMFDRYALGEKSTQVMINLSKEFISNEVKKEPVYYSQKTYCLVR